MLDGSGGKASYTEWSRARDVGLSTLSDDVCAEVEVLLRGGDLASDLEVCTGVGAGVVASRYR